MIHILLALWKLVFLIEHWIAVCFVRVLEIFKLFFNRLAQNVCVYEIRHYFNKLTYKLQLVEIVWLQARNRLLELNTLLVKNIVFFSIHTNGELVGLNHRLSRHVRVHKQFMIPIAEKLSFVIHDKFHVKLF